MPNEHPLSIVVTGAYGQLGGELCRRLGANAISLDIDTLDLTDGQAVADKLLALKPTAVINCAAYTQVDKAESEPEKCRAVNAGAVEHLARVCGTLDCPLVQISTDYVFGAAPERPRPWREDDPVSAQGVYARTKLEGERIAARWAKHLIVRTCGLYARPCDQRAANFVRTMLRVGGTRSELRVVDDQCCTPTYVPHLARAIVFLLGCGKGDSPHLCNDQRGGVGARLRAVPAGTDRRLVGDCPLFRVPNGDGPVGNLPRHQHRPGDLAGVRR